MNEITIVVSSKDRTTFDDTGRKVDRLEAKAKDLGDEFGRTSQHSDELGRSIQGASTKADAASAIFDRLEAHSARLRQEFDRTGGGGQLFDSSSAERGLGKIRTDLTQALETGVKDAVPAVEDTLSSAGQAANKTFWQTFSSMPPEAQAAIAAAVGALLAVSGTFIGAAVSGAILAGVGSVGIGAAIAGQIHNPQVEAELAWIGRDLKSTLTGSSGSFAPVLVKGLERIDELVRKIEPMLGSTFSKIAPDADRLFHGIEGLAENALPGFLHGVEAGGKILGRFGDDLSGLGASFSMFFDEISQGSTGASDALHDILILVEATTVGLGWALKTLSQNFTYVEMAVDLATGNFVDFSAKVADIKNGVNSAAAVMPDLSTDIGDVGSAAQRTSQYLADMNDELDKAFHKHMDADAAALRYKESITALGDSIKQNGRHWDENTAAGQRNTAALQAALDAAERKRAADVANGKDALLAAQEFNTEATQAFNIAAGAGMAKTELDKLKGSYLVNIQEVVNIVTNANRQGKVQNTLDRLGGGRAAGGPAGGLTQVAEQGRELARLPGGSWAMLPQGSQVYSNPDTERMLAAGAGGQSRSGSTDVAIHFAGPGLDTMFATYLQRLIATGQIRISAN